MPVNRQKIDRNVLVLFAAILAPILGIVFLSFLLGERDISAIDILIMASVLVTLFLVVLTIVNQEKYWWAPRGLAAILAVNLMGVSLFVLLQTGMNDWKIIILVILSVLIVGVPSVFYVLWGDATGKVFSSEWILSSKANKSINLIVVVTREASILALIILFILTLIYVTTLLFL